MSKRSKVQVQTDFEKHRDIFEFWNLPKPTESDNYVHIHFDKDAFFKQGQNVIDRIEAEKRYKEDGLKPSTLQGLGAERALQRERRLDDLRQGIKSGKYKTVEQAVLGLDGIRTSTSVINYLKELGMKLKYEKTGMMVGSDEPLLSRKSNSMLFKEVKSVYYDGDPLDGGKRVTKSAYEKIKSQALKELKKQLNYRDSAEVSSE